MGKDWLGYDQMVEDALRGVVRKALSEAASQGLPDDHHFYITFDTRHPDVGLSALLRAQYPDEMTIVLQYQFWGLEIGEKDFSVTLSFGGKQERLTVPFAAIKSFADPSVKFGLQFETPEIEDNDDIPAQDNGEESTTAPAFPPVDKTPASIPASASRKDDRAKDGTESTKESSGATVVALDSFRKNNPGK